MRAITLLRMVFIISMISLVLGAAALAMSIVALTSIQAREEAPLPNVVFEKFIIVGRGGRPVMDVWFSSDRWPVLVRLLDTGRRTIIDEVLVELPEDIPVTMYPCLQTQPYPGSKARNIIPGTYYLRFYKAPRSFFEWGDLLTSAKIEIKGPDFEFIEGKIFVKEFGQGQWYIYGVSFRANNTGDSPAYIDSIKVEIENGPSGWFHRDKVAVFSKGRSGAMAITKDYGVIPLSPGRYTVWIVIDLGYNTWKCKVMVVVG